MPKVRKVKYGKGQSEQLLVEQPYYNDVPLKKWIHIDKNGDEYVIWENGIKFENLIICGNYYHIPMWWDRDTNEIWFNNLGSSETTASAGNQHRYTIGCGNYISNNGGQHTNITLGKVDGQGFGEISTVEGQAISTYNDGYFPFEGGMIYADSNTGSLLRVMYDDDKNELVVKSIGVANYDTALLNSHKLPQVRYCNPYGFPSEIIRDWCFLDYDGRYIGTILKDDAFVKDDSVDPPKYVRRLLSTPMLWYDGKNLVFIALSMLGRVNPNPFPSEIFTRVSYDGGRNWFTNDAIFRTFTALFKDDYGDTVHHPNYPSSRFIRVDEGVIFRNEFGFHKLSSDYSAWSTISTPKTYKFPVYTLNSTTDCFERNGSDTFTLKLPEQDEHLQWKNGDLLPSYLARDYIVFLYGTISQNMYYVFWDITDGISVVGDKSFAVRHNNSIPYSKRKKIKFEWDEE